jgi:predicted MFS family arabinose efflux permease
VPLSTFRRRSLSVANGISAAVGAVVFGMYFFLSLYLQEVQGYSPLRAGLAFLPIGVATFATALAAGPFVRHLGVRRQLILAPLLSCGAAVWLSQLGYSLAFLIIAAISAAGALTACLLRGEAVPDADSEAEPVAFE